MNTINDKIEYDFSTVNKDGTFTARLLGEFENKYKLAVIFKKETLYYTLTTQLIKIPVQYGNGIYTIRFYESVDAKSNKFINLASKMLSVTLKSAITPFINPNVYVNYTKQQNIFSNSGDIINDIKQFVHDKLQYNYLKAATIRKETLPDVKNVIENKIGICQDLAAFCVSQMRLNRIPAKLVIGYADKNYHAWVEYLDNGKWLQYDPTLALKAIKQPKKYTVERFY